MTGFSNAQKFLYLHIETAWVWIDKFHIYTAGREISQRLSLFLQDDYHILEGFIQAH
jgi:hypothetical protein